MRNITLKKIQLTVLGIVLIFSLFTFIYFPGQQKEILLDGYNKEVQNIANTVALGTNIALTEQNFQGVQTAMEEAKKNPQLIFISIVQKDSSFNGKIFSITRKVLNTFPENYNLDPAIISTDSIIVKRANLNTSVLNGEVITGFSTKNIYHRIMKLRFSSLYWTVLVTLLGLLLGRWLDRSISVPIQILNEATMQVGDGVREIELSGNPSDQVGQLVNSFNEMVVKLAEAEKQIHKKNKELEKRNKDVTDSINYAQRIQKALLASDNLLNKNLKEHFVFFRPKDIVSGDFYWAAEKNNRFYLAVCDSTGHGVPGAFMSLLNISFLNEAINEEEIIYPNEIFDHVRQRLIENFSSEGARDGMDGILICFDRDKNEITYAGANNAPLIMQRQATLVSADGEIIERQHALTELYTDSMHVGLGEKKDPFTHQAISFEEDDFLYFYTDGFADQFGGPKGKKFKYKPLNEKISGISNRPPEEQKMILQKTFEDWKGNLEQVDDVLVIGIKV
jgi:serine phosphatase RsbU (regulator of sigma subunit)